MKYQLLTIAQLAEFIASQLDYSKIWESKFPNCDFVIIDAEEMRQYSIKELEDMHRDACGWCGIKKAANLFDSTTLYAFADHYGGGCDNIGRLYDGIGVLEAEIVLQEVICGTLAATETVTDDTILLVEFLNTEDQDAPDSEKIFFIPIEGAQKIIQDYNARQETHREDVPAEYLHAFMAKERDGSWTAIDNRDGNCWTENFKSFDVAKRWLMDKNDTDEGFNKVFDGQHYNVYDADGHEITILPPVGPPVPDDDLLCEAGDEIDNAVYAAICAMTVKKPEWDMSVIGEVEDTIEEILKRNNIPVCRPWENEDGHVCYSLPEKRCKHCTRHAAAENS